MQKAVRVVNHSAPMHDIQNGGEYVHKAPPRPCTFLRTMINSPSSYFLFKLITILLFTMVDEYCPRSGILHNTVDTPYCGRCGACLIGGEASPPSTSRVVSHDTISREVVEPPPPYVSQRTPTQDRQTQSIIQEHPSQATIRQHYPEHRTQSIVLERVRPVETTNTIPATVVHASSLSSRARIPPAIPSIAEQYRQGGFRNSRQQQNQIVARGEDNKTVVSREEKKVIQIRANFYQTTFIDDPKTRGRKYIRKDTNYMRTTSLPYRLLSLTRSRFIRFRHSTMSIL
jgi:hypothetical protein